MFGPVHDRCQLRHLRPDLVGDGAPLGAGGLSRVRGEGRGDEGGDDPAAALAGVCQDIALQVHTADDQRGRLIGRTKGGMNTTLHAVTDADGRPIRFFMTAGQVGDYTGAAALLGSFSGLFLMREGLSWNRGSAARLRCGSTRRRAER